MEQPTPSSSAETNALLFDAYAALNRNDIARFVRMLDAEIEWIIPSEWPGGGTFRGVADVEAMLRRSRAMWAEGSCEPERSLVVGDRVVLFAQVHVRLKQETDWRDGQIADVHTFRDGKVIHIRTFGDGQQALEWAAL